jgi:hypothetical protein
LSASRTRQLIPAFLTIAFAGPVIALMGAASGTGHGGGSPGSVTTVALALRAVPQAAPGAAGQHAAAERGRPQRIAMSLLRHRFHWKQWQFKYLNRLWAVESGWNRYAANPYSGAYGIPQAMPGDKMASAGPGWQWNARTQILWGLRYIRACYRTPYWAWLHQHETGWY